MKLDLGTCAFGYKLKKGTGTPNWATSLGQAKGYKINEDPEIDNILRGMIYMSIPVKNVEIKVGRGGNYVSGDSNDSPIVIASLFNKVYINQNLIPDGKFILLITKDTSESHKGRLRLKYGPSNKYKIGLSNYKDEYYENNNFFSLAKKHLNLAENACWFINEITIVNQDELHFKAIIVNPDGVVEYDDSKSLHSAWNELTPNTELIIEQEINGFNKIFYGIPGCGKSYKVNAMLNHDPEYLNEALRNGIINKANKEDVIRTTFYLDYSNSDFIGQIYPCVEKKEIINKDGSIEYKDIVTYKQIPGPFTKALLQAYQHLIDHNPSRVYLVIEELNRGNAAAIFGDTFQLLDRKNGDSEYSINNEFIESYLRKKLTNIENLPSKYELSKILIPKNLTIFATMNTNDQNVFSLDTAFKRRWYHERVTNTWNKDKDSIMNLFIPFSNIKWGDFVKTINKEMITESIKKDLPISEDKQMGEYFVTKKMLSEHPMNTDLTKLNNFANSVLDYLYNDVTKFNHSILFNSNLISTNQIYEIINSNINSNKCADNQIGAQKVESECIFSGILTKNITDKLIGISKKEDNQYE